ncbi:MAG: hypothetical protein KJZ65_12065 [Phycisphaerales bacterium]|nr:hypothetical protein [Phycisphaerales bacterium]
MKAPSEDGYLLIEPPPGRWGALWAQGRSAPTWVRPERFREQMGLPARRPLVMSGHQAGLWHAGIAAKYFTLRALEGVAATAWLVADLDENDVAYLRVPVRDAHGAWTGRMLDLAEKDEGHPDAASGFRPTVRVRRDVPEVARPAAEAMEQARASARTLAEQGHRAAEKVLESAGIGLVRPVVYGSATARTDLFGDLVRRMCEDPDGCVRAYNAAAAAFPDAGVRALMCRAERGRFELPIWRVGMNQPRLPVLVERGQTLDCGNLAPRGLLMTGMLRLAGCEMFIHGTGGGAYDRVTQRWLSDWLGPDVVLAPVAVVSATRLVDLGVEPVAEAVVSRAVAAAHRARHDPALLGDEEGGLRKRELVAKIRGLARGSAGRAAAYRAMHELLRKSVCDHADALARLEGQAGQMRNAMASSEAARDRTWSIALHAPTTLRSLGEQVRAALAQAASRTMA